MKYYKNERNLKFSQFLRLANTEKDNNSTAEKIVEIICYCIMPTHIHLILKQLKEKGLSLFMNNILNSYTHYFNFHHKRKGPLWESRFKHVLIDTDEYLLHLTRYIHLNPVTAGLVDKPELWEFSSYKEYIGMKRTEYKLCNFKEVLEINPNSYKEFVENGILTQKEIAKIKHILLENFGNSIVPLRGR
ncbi:MAG: transposase [Candidatus Omnitrophica bacterium]|nr:transposase [Candidatus Omnitrophota bacterium]MCM8777005.1 transposase [Candidatus Omnitrophota bacterium]